MKIGFIGCGNMGTAMAKGILDSGKCKPEDMIFSAKSEESREKKSKMLGIKAVADNKEVAKASDVIFLAVKPQFYEEVIKEIKDCVNDSQLIISIAPGKTLEWFDEVFGRKLKVIRTMPNTPSMVKEGMMGMCANDMVTAEELDMVRDICDGFSATEVVAEKLMFIEAMADAAVAGGMPRSQAYKFAAQAVLGSARMVLETGMHPGELKDMVCSPAGTTIQAVRVLEDKGMRSSVIEAMMKCLDISRNM